MKDEVRRFIQWMFHRHASWLPHPELLFLKFANLSKDQRVVKRVWQLLSVWTIHVQSMPEGIDRDFQESALREVKGLLKAWRLWRVKKEMDRAKGSVKTKRLRRRAQRLRSVNFSRDREFRQQRRAAAKVRPRTVGAGAGTDGDATGQSVRFF